MNFRKLRQVIPFPMKVNYIGNDPVNYYGIRIVRFLLTSDQTHGKTARL